MRCESNTKTSTHQTHSLEKQKAREVKLDLRSFSITFVFNITSQTPRSCDHQVFDVLLCWTQYSYSKWRFSHCIFNRNSSSSPREENSYSYVEVWLQLPVLLSTFATFLFQRRMENVCGTINFIPNPRRYTYIYFPWLYSTVNFRSA